MGRRGLSSPASDSSRRGPPPARPPRPVPAPWPGRPPPRPAGRPPARSGPPPEGRRDPEEGRRGGTDIGARSYERERPFAPGAKNGSRAPQGGPRVFEIRRRPTLPGGLPPSTIGAGSLNFRVRDGNGCDPAAIATEICCQGCATAMRRRQPSEYSRASTSVFKPSPRPISTGRLRVLPHLHLRPINVMVSSRALLR